MRLTPKQAQIIKATSQQVFGEATKVYLFGRRVDNSLKGGDIDLYLVPEQQNPSLEQRLRLGALLQQQLGEQRIDIVVAKNSARLIEQEALRTGAKL